MEVSQSLNFTPRPGFLKRTNYTDLLGSLVGAPEKKFQSGSRLENQKSEKEIFRDRPLGTACPAHSYRSPTRNFELIRWNGCLGRGAAHCVEKVEKSSGKLTSWKVIKGDLTGPLAQSTEKFVSDYHESR